jgi:hypothetical protein
MLTISIILSLYATLCYQERALFDIQQTQLEQFTDELHGLTEAPIEQLVPSEMRVRMLSFCATVSKYRRGVMEAIQASNERMRITQLAAAASSNPSRRSMDTPAAAAASAGTSSSKARSSLLKK